jgi:hypothetical protein
VRDSLAHASERLETVQSPAADRDEVGGLRGCNEGLHGLLAVLLHCPSLASEPLRESSRGAERGFGPGGAVVPDDDLARPCGGIVSRPGNQHGALRVMEHPRGHCSEQQAGGAAPAVRADGDQGRVLRLGLTLQDRGGVAVHEPRLCRGSDRLCLLESRLGIALEKVRGVPSGHSSMRGLAEVDRGEEQELAVVREPDRLPDRSEARGRAVDTADDPCPDSLLIRHVPSLLQMDTKPSGYRRGRCVRPQFRRVASEE